MANIQILPISPDASDGIGSGPANSKTAYRDDSHYLDKIAERWAKELGKPMSGVTYRLDRLPTGYAGYACPRENESKHIDRYLYGHPKGHFRSMNELWPHFLNLQNVCSSAGCPCKLCTGKKSTSTKPRLSASNSNSFASSSPGEQSRFFAPPPAFSKPPSVPRKRSSDENDLNDLPQGRLTSGSDSSPKRRKQTDDEGTPDLVASLIADLKDAGEEGLEKEIAEQMSPDWRASHNLVQELLSDWSALPKFVPRLGELVLFARNISEDEIGWDTGMQTLRTVDVSAHAWLDRVKWEAGVVTQMPTESITMEDLSRIPGGKKNVAYSGFRIEPLSEPRSDTKPFSKQHKYVPLHALRPFSFWKECLSDQSSDEWHPTIRHALTVASSFCVIGRYTFKGTWPEAAIFVRGVYLGPELIMVGDTVRLLPTKADPKPVTDVLIVTSIRLRLAKLDQAQGDQYPSALHIAGRAFTLDPKESFGGIAKTPAVPGRDGLPEYLQDFGTGTWFSKLDPNNSKARLEVPFSRILGRCVEHKAIKAWFSTPRNIPPPPSSFQAVNASSTSAGKTRVLDISQGLKSMRDARKYSTQHDTRIDKQSDKIWFWADSRIEQLDLHELNSHSVGVKDSTRTPKQMHTWRQALKLLDGKKGGFEQYQAALKQRQEEAKQLETAQAPAFGMMATAAQQGNGTDAEEAKSRDEDMEVEDEEGGHDMRRAGAQGAIVVDDDDVEMID